MAWTDDAKNSASFTDDAKNSSSWTDDTIAQLGEFDIGLFDSATFDTVTRAAVDIWTNDTKH